MNLIQFLNNLSNPELLTKPISRRNSLNELKKTGKDLALVSIPFALAATSSKSAAAATTMASASMQASPVEVLKFALTLEYLERDFYDMGLDSGVIPSNDRDVFNLIYEHEKSHVEFLKIALDSVGADVPDAPSFDFTAGGLVQPFQEYTDFLALAQGFEDTGVRAYKGQAGALIERDAFLEYALQIHSVEARHASKVRRLRGDVIGQDIKGWIVGDGDQSFLPSQFSAIYAGEGQTVQLGIQLADKFGSYEGITEKHVTEAFDEPLTMDEVFAIAGFFIKQ